MLTDPPNHLIADPARLASLASYDIFDTPAETGFDDIVRLATRLCAAPVALVSLVGADRQWFKARIAFPHCETDLDASVCRYALVEPDLLVITDLAADPRTAANPLVTGDPHIRFYAGAPLRMPDGHVLGSLCVIDTKPRPGGLTAEQADDLRALGRQVAGLLTMRRAVERRDEELDGQRAELQQARRMDVVAKAAAALTVARDPAAVLEPILAEGAASVGFEQCFMYDLAPDGEHLHLVRSVGTSEAVRTALQRANLDGPLCGMVVRSRGSVVLTDVQASGDPRHAVAREAGTNGYAGYPIISRGQIVGVVSFATRAARFDAEALTFFSTLAGLISGVRERLDNEAALRDSDTRSRRAQEAGQVGTFEVDVGSGVVTASPELARIYGLPPAAHYKADQFEALIVPEDRRIASRDETRRDGSAAPDVEYRIRRADDGALRWVARRGGFERDPHGNVTRMLGTLQDVTDRREAQDALRDNAERLRLVIESAKDHAILTTDPAGTVTSWSAGAEAAFGWSAEEAIGRPADIIFTAEDRAAGVPARELSTARQEGCSNDDRWHLARNGARVYMNGSVHPLQRDARGHERGFIKIARDETRRREVDEALRTSEARFRALATAGAQTMYHMSPDWQEMRRLDGAGFLADTSAPSVRWLEDYIDPADRPGVLDAIEDANRRKGVFELEHRVRRADGTLGWTLSRAVPILAPHGEILEWFGAASDVSDRRAARESLQASESYWRGLFSRLSEGFIVGEVVRDPEGSITDWRYIDVNPAWGKLVGIDPAGVAGRTIREVFPGIEDAWITDFAGVVETGEPVTFAREVATVGRHYEGRSFKLSRERFGVLFLETTDRVRAEARRDALLLLGDRLRDLTTVAAMTSAACAIVGHALGATRAAFARVIGDMDEAEVEPDWTTPGVASIAGRHRFARYGDVREQLRRGEPLVIDDVDADPRVRDEAAVWRGIEVAALVNVPVRERDRVVALLLVHDDEPRRWTAEELAFLRDVADRVELGVARVQAEQQQAVLNGEISHRLKNTLAMVISIAGQTLRRVADREPVQAFEKRMHALSSAHDVLTGRNWSTAPLSDVVRTVLADAGQADRIDIEGPDIQLGPRATLSLTLLAHELATNAAKYGALASAGGRVSVTWWLDGTGPDAEVVLQWTERGGAAPTAPSDSGRKGFGSRLIAMGLAGTGGVELRYPPSGFSATMRAPLAQLQLS